MLFFFFEKQVKTASLKKQFFKNQVFFLDRFKNQDF